MQVTTETGERVVCAVLAAQVAAIRERFDADPTVELLWRTTDMIALLSNLLLELARERPAADAALTGRVTTAVADAAGIGQALDGLAMLQAQRDDFGRQMADCVVTALQRLASAETPGGARLSPAELAALYVSEDQRTVHDSVIRQFAAIGASTGGRTANGSHP
jgi:hypothetical protein